jgi:hypothetical protein
MTSAIVGSLANKVLGKPLNPANASVSLPESSTTISESKPRSEIRRWLGTSLSRGNALTCATSPNSLSPTSTAGSGLASGGGTGGADGPATGAAGRTGSRAANDSTAGAADGTDTGAASGSEPGAAASSCSRPLTCPLVSAKGAGAGSVARGAAARCISRGRRGIACDGNGPPVPASASACARMISACVWSTCICS